MRMCVEGSLHHQFFSSIGVELLNPLLENVSVFFISPCVLLLLLFLTFNTYKYTNFNKIQEKTARHVLYALNSLLSTEENRYRVAKEGLIYLIHSFVCLFSFLNTSLLFRWLFLALHPFNYKRSLGITKILLSSFIFM